MSKDVSLPLEAVGEAAATELAGKTLLYTARPTAAAAAAAAAAGGRRKDVWETEFEWLLVSLVYFLFLEYLKTIDIFMGRVYSLWCNYKQYTNHEVN